MHKINECRCNAHENQLRANADHFVRLSNSLSNTRYTRNQLNFIFGVIFFYIVVCIWPKKPKNHKLKYQFRLCRAGGRFPFNVNILFAHMYTSTLEHTHIHTRARVSRILVEIDEVSVINYPKISI